METCLPRVDQSGKLNLRKTGGLTGTMVDIVKAVQNQDIFMIHIVDAIEAINMDHMGSEMATERTGRTGFCRTGPGGCRFIVRQVYFQQCAFRRKP